MVWYTGIELELSSLSSKMISRAPMLTVAARRRMLHMAAISKSTSIKTLHVYDHCPFCIRVDLYLGWNNVTYDRKIYGYGDLSGPTSLTGKKLLPVLEYEKDGTTHCLTESLDIIEYLSKHANLARLLPRTNRKSLVEWEEQHKPSVNDLTRPRLVSGKIPPELVDFATQEDRDYAISKYEKSGFSYEAARERESVALEECAKSLQRFEDEFLHGSETSLHHGNSYGMDDIIYLPDLRKLTLVKDLKWPKKVRRYVEMATRDGGVRLYDDWAF